MLKLKNKYIILFCFVFLCIHKKVQAQSVVNGTVLSEEGISISNVLVYNIVNQKKPIQILKESSFLKGNIMMS